MFEEEEQPRPSKPKRIVVDVIESLDVPTLLNAEITPDRPRNEKPDSENTNACAAEKVDRKVDRKATSSEAEGSGGQDFPKSGEETMNPPRQPPAKLSVFGNTALDRTPVAPSTPKALLAVPASVAINCSPDCSPERSKNPVPARDDCAEDSLAFGEGFGDSPFALQDSPFLKGGEKIAIDPAVRESYEAADVVLRRSLDQIRRKLSECRNRTIPTQHDDAEETPLSTTSGGPFRGSPPNVTPASAASGPGEVAGLHLVAFPTDKIATPPRPRRLGAAYYDPNRYAEEGTIEKPISSRYGVAVAVSPTSSALPPQLPAPPPPVQPFRDAGRTMDAHALAPPVSPRLHTHNFATSLDENPLDQLNNSQFPPRPSTATSSFAVVSPCEKTPSVFPVRSTPEDQKGARGGNATGGTTGTSEQVDALSKHHSSILESLEAQSNSIVTQIRNCTTRLLERKQRHQETMDRLQI